MKFDGDVMRPYRIKTDKWRRSWQSENPDVCRFARRAYTPRGARRRMERDSRIEAAGGRSLFQKVRWWSVRKWDAEQLRIDLDRVRNG